MKEEVLPLPSYLHPFEWIESGKAIPRGRVPLSGNWCENRLFQQQEVDPPLESPQARPRLGQSIQQLG